MRVVLLAASDWLHLVLELVVVTVIMVYMRNNMSLGLAWQKVNFELFCMMVLRTIAEVVEL